MYWAWKISRSQNLWWTELKPVNFKTSRPLTIVFTWNTSKCIWPLFIKTLTGIVIPRMTVLTLDPTLITAITVSDVTGWTLSDILVFYCPLLLHFVFLDFFTSLSLYAYQLNFTGFSLFCCLRLLLSLLCSRQLSCFLLCLFCPALLSFLILSLLLKLAKSISAFAPISTFPDTRDWRVHLGTQNVLQAWRWLTCWSLTAWIAAAIDASVHWQCWPRFDRLGPSTFFLVFAIILVYNMKRYNHHIKLCNLGLLT